MTIVTASDAAKDASTDSNPSDTLVETKPDVAMANVKTEDGAQSAAPGSHGAAATDQDIEGDSEAETLIQSPEKKKNIVDGAPTLQPSGAKVSNGAADGVAASDTARRSRKRKREGQDVGDIVASRGSSSSPLSSPGPQAQSHNSDSEVSDTPRSARSQRSRRALIKTEANLVDGSLPVKARKRRPSDIVPPTKHRVRGSVGNIEGAIERRETRSATYPRQSSEERSPSPRPTSGREHRRGVSTQITTGDVERKRRGRPPNITTRRNRSLDRDESESSEDESSPAPHSRPGLDKYDSRHDHMSPAKPSGPRKWRDKNGRTFLSRACNNEDLERAQQCFEERPEDLNMPDNAGNTPLQIASLEGFTDIVRFLLQSGAEVDTRNIDKDTPLIDAVENGHFEVIQLLLGHGANPRLANAKGDEPYELVPTDDENYKQIRKLIADAKDQDWTKRRKSNDNDANREGDSSRAPSAASARDSPPVIGPRSPPTLASRRRTGRSESTRNDLLWQQNTQENLQRLAAKGNVQGVATILNVLQKAEPASVIAAAKAGHEEVLQYLLAMGEADPDPEPQSDLKPGFNTPMLAAIGRGNLDVVKLLVEQTGFNPARKYKGRAYFEIAAERKGDSWQKEHDILKSAYDKSSGKSKTKSPKKVREIERPREKRLRRSESPPSSNLRTSSSPTMTHKSLPDKSPRALRKEVKKDTMSPIDRERRKLDGLRDDPNVAVVSDQEQTVTEKRGHKHRRSQSDLPLPPNLEAEITQRRRRLVTGKEHRRSQSGVGPAHSEGSTSEIEVKRERLTPGVKRNRTSVSPEPKDGANTKVVSKKRRTVLESSPEETRPSARNAAAKVADPVVGSDKKSPDTNQVAPKAKEAAQQHTRRRSQQVQRTAEAEIGTITTAQPPPSEDKSMEDDDAPGEPDVAPMEDPMPEVATSIEDPKPSQPDPDQTDPPQPQVDEQNAGETQVTQEKNAAEKQLEEAKASAERVAAEKQAAEEAEAARIAAEQAAAEKAEAERQVAEDKEARRKAEEAELKRKAEEEAVQRKREQEEREEQKRRELQRRQEEQIRQQHQEIERRRREALPAALSTAALLLESSDIRAKSHEWLSHFLPLYTARTGQLDPSAPPSVSQDEWIPNFQAAVLLATKDLNLRNYTSLERRPATEEERMRLWKVARHMLSYDYISNSYNTTVKRAVSIEEEQRPKFMSMAELFWVKVGDGSHVIRKCC